MSGAQAGAAADEEAKPKGGGKKGLLVSLVLALAGVGGGFFATSSGLLPIGTSAKASDAPPAGHSTATAVAFLPVDPIIVSLGATGMNRHLSFRAQLEVPETSSAEVAAVMPRIVDVMNGYLRAVDVREFDAPHGLIRLRAQLLRRVQLIVGDGKVNDLLVMEFVLN